MKMNKVFEELKKTRLMVLARGIEKDVLVKAVGAIADAGVTVFESTFDHRHENCIAENAEKIAALVAAYGERMSIGAGTVLTIDEVRAAHEAGAAWYGVHPGRDDSKRNQARACARRGHREALPR